jgi:hypothetical protein
MHTKISLSSTSKYILAYALIVNEGSNYKQSNENDGRTYARRVFSLAQPGATTGRGSREICEAGAGFRACGFETVAVISNALALLTTSPAHVCGR